MIYAGQDAFLLDWANEKLGVKFDYRDCHWISNIGDNGIILGVVIMSRFSPWNCELSVVSISPRFLTRELLRVVFNYLFNQIGLVRATSVIETDNEKALKLNRGLGFIDEGLLKNWFGSKDGIVLGLLKKDCKWHTKV